MNDIPPDREIVVDGVLRNEKEYTLEVLAYAYPTWFFEVLCELEEGKPLVFEKFQIDILLDFESKLSITNKCRQAGGSLIFAAEEFYKAYTQKNYRCDIVSKTLSGSADNVAYIRRLWDSLPGKYKKPLSTDNVTSIGFHAKNPSLVRSFAPTASVRGGRKSILFDEYAHWPLDKQDLIFTAALPAILNGDLSLRIVSTPLGDMNKFADIFLNRKNDRGKYPFKDFSRHQFIWLDVTRFVKGYNADPSKHDPRPFQEVQYLWYEEYGQNMDKMEELVDNYGSEATQLILSNLSWEDFLTEMCGSFINFQNQFFAWDVINKASKGELASADDQSDEAFEIWREERPKGNSNEVVAGIDFGESTPKTDKTAIQIIEKRSSHMGRPGEYLQRANIVLNDAIYGVAGYTAQTTVIANILKKYRVNRVVADSTNIGGPILEMLKPKLGSGIPIEEVNFQNKNKEEMIVNLRFKLEEQSLWIQDEDKMLQRELAGIRRTPTATGLIRYHGEPHDDRVWALALAVKDRSYANTEFYVLG